MWTKRCLLYCQREANTIQVGKCSAQQSLSSSLRCSTHLKNHTKLPSRQGVITGILREGEAPEYSTIYFNCIYIFCDKLLTINYFGFIIVQGRCWTAGGYVSKWKIRHKRHREHGSGKPDLSYLWTLWSHVIHVACILKSTVSYVFLLGHKYCSKSKLPWNFQTCSHLYTKGDFQRIHKNSLQIVLDPLSAPGRL